MRWIGVHLLRRMVQPNWVVFGVGAHIGYFALLLSRMVGPGGKVVAFEPSPDIFRILEENHPRRSGAHLDGTSEFGTDGGGNDRDAHELWSSLISDVQE